MSFDRYRRAFVVALALTAAPFVGGATTANADSSGYGAFSAFSDATASPWSNARSDFVAPRSLSFNRDRSGLAFTSIPVIRLPEPLEFAIAYEHGKPRIKGLAVAASRDISLRASGGFKSRAEGLRGNVSIVFKF